MVDDAAPQLVRVRRSDEQRAVDLVAHVVEAVEGRLGGLRSQAFAVDHQLGSLILRQFRPAFVDPVDQCVTGGLAAEPSTRKEIQLGRNEYWIAAIAELPL